MTRRTPLYFDAQRVTVAIIAMQTTVPDSGHPDYGLSRQPLHGLGDPDYGLPRMPGCEQDLGVLTPYCSKRVVQDPRGAVNDIPPGFGQGGTIAFNHK